MYILDVRMPVQLLQALVQVFQSDSTDLKLIGNPSQLDAHLLENITIRDWPGSGPYSRIIEIPLTRENVQALLKSVLPRVGVQRNVHEITIAEIGKDQLKPLFCAFDNFSPWEGITGRYNKGAGVTSHIDVELLDNLLQKQIIRKYLAEEPSESRG